MRKKSTGRKIETSDFKKMNMCVECGYADYMKKGDSCDNCKLLNRPRCEYCEGIMRDEHIHYSYDSNDKLRHLDSLKLSKKPIREFLLVDKSYTIPFDEKICEYCHELQEDILRNKRTIRCQCGDRLCKQNDLIEYIKVNGRQCSECILINEILLRKLTNK